MVTNMEKETITKMHDEAMAEYAALHGHINYLRKKLGLDALPPISGQSGKSEGIRVDSFFGHTIGSAIEKYLKIGGEPKTYQEITDALSSGGLNHNSKNLSSTVNSVLFKYDKAGKVFVHLPSGQWGLREWYPMLRKTRKNGDAESTEAIDDNDVEIEEGESVDPKPEKAAKS